MRNGLITLIDMFQPLQNGTSTTTESLPPFVPPGAPPIFLDFSFLLFIGVPALFIIVVFYVLYRGYRSNEDAFHNKWETGRSKVARAWDRAPDKAGDFKDWMEEKTS